MTAEVKRISDRRRKARLGMWLLLLLLLPFAIMAWKVYSDDWQQKLNRALVSAAMHNDIAVVTVLLAEGADPNARDLPPDTRSIGRRIWDRLQGKSSPNGHIPTALLAGLASNAGERGVVPKNFAVVKALVDAGAAVNVSDEGGTTPLMWAARMPRGETAILLLDRGADVNAKDVDGATALHSAAATMGASQSQLLLARGARVDVRNGNGETPLYAAVSDSNTAIARTLLESGAEIDARDRDGKTPLAAAVTTESIDCVRLLLSRGAQVQTKDRYGITPLALARHNENAAVVNMLKKAGEEAARRKAQSGEAGRVNKRESKDAP